MASDPRSPEVRRANRSQTQTRLHSASAGRLDFTPTLTHTARISSSFGSAVITRRLFERNGHCYYHSETLPLFSLIREINFAERLRLADAIRQNIAVASCNSVSQPVLVSPEHEHKEAANKSRPIPQFANISFLASVWRALGLPGASWCWAHWTRGIIGPT